MLIVFFESLFNIRGVPNIGFIGTRDASNDISKIHLFHRFRSSQQIVNGLITVPLRFLMCKKISKKATEYTILRDSLDSSWFLH
jgi:hypothetical protein